MAQTLTYTPVRCVGWKGTHPEILIPLPIGATQTIYNGSLMVISSGTLVVASTNPTATYGVAMEAGNGLAFTTASPDNWAGTFDGLSSLTKSLENNSLHIAAATTQNIFEANFSGVLSSTLVSGLTYGMTLDATTHNWYIDASKSGSNQIATIYKIYNDTGHGNVGDTNARVQFQFIPADTVLLT